MPVVDSRLAIKQTWSCRTKHWKALNAGPKSRAWRHKPFVRQTPRYTRYVCFPGSGGQCLSGAQSMFRDEHSQPSVRSVGAHRTVLFKLPGKPHSALFIALLRRQSPL